MNEREKFEKWWSVINAADWASPFERQAARDGWQAALSTRKAYGYGIVDKDGDAITDCVEDDKSTAESFVERWNSVPEASSGCPFRVVELFYEDSES